MVPSTLVAFLSLAVLSFHESQAFLTIRPSLQQQQYYSALQKTSLYSTTEKRPRSRVSDPTGPTPPVEEEELETVKEEDIPELQYDENAHPVPHQPWRRGETDGCEDPIDAEWRQEAEDLIRKAVEIVGGSFVDVTWYLTHVVVTIEKELAKVPRDFLKADGPVISIETPEDPMYKDPADPNPEDIWDDDDNIVYQRDEETEMDIKSKMYAPRDPEDEDEDEPVVEEEEDVPLYMNQETREDDALRVAEEANLLDLAQERPFHVRQLAIDTAALSTIAGAIMDSLETVEDKLRVLDRHEIVLTSPGAPDVLETQKQFDAHRGFDVAVETQDPWDSNRTLKGKLVDRNSMDVIINQAGRMVTIPLNFVKCVRLPHTKKNSEKDREMFESGETPQEEAEEI